VGDELFPERSTSGAIFHQSMLRHRAHWLNVRFHPSWTFASLGDLPIRHAGYPVSSGRSRPRASSPS
jgi:hypothetical protein